MGCLILISTIVYIYIYMCVCVCVCVCARVCVGAHVHKYSQIYIYIYLALWFRLRLLLIFGQETLVLRPVCQNEPRCQQSKTWLNISPGTKELAGNLFTCCFELFIRVLLFFFASQTLNNLLNFDTEIHFMLVIVHVFTFTHFCPRVTIFVFTFVCLLVPCTFSVNKI